MSDSKDINTMSFEDAMSELETIVKELESGKTSLEETMEKFTRGTKLQEHCQKKLDETKLKIDTLQQDGA